MNSMFEQMLNNLDWEDVTYEVPPDGKIPYATHMGVIEVGDSALRVYQLSNGKRVIHCDDLEAFFLEAPSELSTTDVQPGSYCHVQGAT